MHEENPFDALGVATLVPCAECGTMGKFREYYLFDLEDEWFFVCEPCYDEIVRVPFREILEAKFAEMALWDPDEIIRRKGAEMLEHWIRLRREREAE